MNYKIHESYPFVATGVLEGKNEKKYIALCKAGEDKVTQFVPAYDFQTEWVDKFPCKMWCEIIDYNADRDIYILQQCYYDLLASLYTGLPQTGKFKVVGSKIDSNTNNHFYILKDAYGLCHRYYANADVYSIGQEVEMLVESVVLRGNRQGYLSLATSTAVQSSASVKECVTKTTESTIASEDPRTTTTFGQEDDHTEFKSSIVFTPADINPRIDEQIKTIMKTIAGFMNKDGGTLYLGVNDAGVVCGIESDFKHLNTSETDRYTYHQNQDGYEIKIRESIKRHLTNASLGNLITLEFKSENEKTYCVVTVEQSKYPVFFNGTKLYQRMGNQTNLLKDFEIYLFIEERINKFGAQTQPVDTEDTTEDEYGDQDGNSIVEPTNEHSEEEKKADEATKIVIERPVFTPWRYVRLYTEGRWSYGKKSMQGDADLVHEIMIPKEKNHKTDCRLVIAYKDGCVDTVALGDVKPKTEDKIYTTKGWHDEIGIVAAFVADERELLAVRCTDVNGEECTKFHKLTDISVHPGMGRNGNTIINADATITAAALVPKVLEDRLGSYLVKKTQKSNFNGFKRSDPSFRDSLHLLDAIFE